MRLLLLLAAWIGAAAPALAADRAPDAPVTAVSTGSQQLFVELVVNGQAGGAIAPLTQDGDRLLVAAEALRAAGIVVPGSGSIDVAHWPQTRATYDAGGQRLLLDVPPALLPTRRIAATAADARVAPLVDTGALLNYDLFVQAAGGQTGASLWTEQRAFGRFGTVSNTGILRVGSGFDGYVRLDTRYRWSDEERALELTAGDLITRALPWSTAVRIGGVQLARSFALRPDLVTVPLPSFAGEAAVPTGVDLFVNGYRQSSTSVAPGRFVLESVPVVNGAGEARIVTTDAVGRQIATVIPFYVASELLRPGLTDFAVEGGALRTGYGLTSFDYRRMVASGSVRHGVTRRLTLSAHAEATRGMGGIGVGAAWAPGLWGALNGAAAVSRTRERSGRQVSVGYTYAGRAIAFGVEHVARSRGFTDLGGFDLGRYAGSRRSDRASLSVPIAGVGSVGAGYIAARLRDGTRVRLVSASLSMPIGARASVFAAADYDLGPRAVSAQVRLVVPFGRATVASGGLTRDADGAGRIQASVARVAPTSTGVGYAADAALTSRGLFLGQASATWRTARLQVEGGAATIGDARSAWGGVTGSVALLEGRAFATRSLPGAFALVSTGAPRVPVYYENQKMGVTDAGGRLFVPNVVANHPARFAIDPVDLPIGAIADRTETRAAMRAGTGAVVRLPVSFHHSVTARMVDAAGVPLPPGTIATLDGGVTATIGWDGVILIEDLDTVTQIVARTAAGPCRATITTRANAAALADLGVFACR